MPSTHMRLEGQPGSGEWFSLHSSLPCPMHQKGCNSQAGRVAPSLEVPVVDLRAGDVIFIRAGEAKVAQRFEIIGSGSLMSPWLGLDSAQTLNCRLRHFCDLGSLTRKL